MGYTDAAPFWDVMQGIEPTNLILINTASRLAQETDGVEIYITRTLATHTGTTENGLVPHALRTNRGLLSKNNHTTNFSHRYGEQSQLGD